MAERLRPFFSYYGAKWSLAPLYPAPQHRKIVEPFAGSACYSLCYPDREVVLYERYPVVAGLWRYLIRVSPAEILALPDLQEGQSAHDLSVPQEARWLIGFWLRKANATPGRTPSAWMRGRAKTWLFWGPRVRQRIASQLELIRHWRVVEVEGADGYRAAAAEGPATYFVDPPYLVGGHRYRFGRIDHAALGGWCRTLQGQVLVCESEAADWLDFRPLAEMRTCRSRRSRSVREMLWTGGGPKGQMLLPLGVSNA